jgi:hypothetical protein
VAISLARAIIAFSFAIDLFFWLKNSLKLLFFFLAAAEIYIQIHFATFDPLL